MRKIDQIAFDAFKEWAAITPNLLSTIDMNNNHRFNIRQDFEIALHKALSSVVKKYNNPQDSFELQLAYGFIEGNVKGNLSVCWSFRYLPPGRYLDYQLWMLSFRRYLAIDEECRLRINRLYCYYKENYPAIGSEIFNKEADMDAEELHAHHITSDIKAELNWQNFEKLFDVFFEENVARALTDRTTVSFHDSTYLFTYGDLEYFYQNRHMF